MPFQAERVVRTYTQTINSTPDVIFPLLCPVRESDWLEGWKYTMLYSSSGVAELGAIFSTPQEGESDTIWIVTKHDPQEHEVEFARVTPGSRAAFIRIKVIPAASNSSYVAIEYTHTALTPEGIAFVRGYSEDEFLNMVQTWERSMNQYLETRRTLQAES
jgi:hypothetical protein